MRVVSCVAVLVARVMAGPAAAVDLTTIDRSLGKEPTYESAQPLYCLLVFGPKAKVRVWVVLDGDVLYVDRNGNGDLTDPGERIKAREIFRDRDVRPDVELMRTFELNCWKAGEEPVLTCGPEVRWFYLHQLLPQLDWPDQEWVRYFRERPFDFAIVTNSGGSERAQLNFASSPTEAPIVHYDGPRHFALSKKWEQQFRPGEPCDLGVELHTSGVNATVRKQVDDVPEHLHPVAEIEFPPGRPGDEPIRKRVKLKERC